jgi:hypothetical protein
VNVVLSEKVVWVFAKIRLELIYYSGFYVAPLSFIELRYESPGNDVSLMLNYQALV